LDTEMAHDADLRFVKFAREHGRATMSGTARETNKAYDGTIIALRELRQIADKGVSVLLGHLQDDDLSVVSWSALCLLPYRELEAVAALERVAQSGQRHTGFEADMTLREWRAGRLKVE
jgi:hypothetical protein